MTAHTPMRPSWRCSGCGGPWPCHSAQRRLIAEFDGASVSLALNLAAQFMVAATELPTVAAGELHERFFGWIRSSSLHHIQLPDADASIATTRRVSASGSTLPAPGTAASARSRGKAPDARVVDLDVVSLGALDLATLRTRIRVEEGDLVFEVTDGEVSVDFEVGVGRARARAILGAERLSSAARELALTVREEFRSGQQPVEPVALPGSEGSKRPRQP